MTDLEITKQLKTLARIQPGKDYAAFSKMVILGKEDIVLEDAKWLETKLASIKAIQPNANYALSSKLLILESKKPAIIGLLEAFSARNFFARSANYAFAMGLAAILVSVLAVEGYNKYLNPSAPLYAANRNAVLADADSIRKDIDLRMKEIEYYSLASKKTDIALNEVSRNDFGSLNNAVIEREAGRIEPEDPINQDIEKLLEEASL